MQLQAQPPSTHRTGPAPCLILASRDHYLSCRIQVPDLDRPIGAICVGDRYYGFFKAAPDCRKVLGIAVKLSYQGDSIVLTKVGKGYGVWVWEPDAHPLPSLPAKTLPLPAPATCRILVSRNQYQMVDIQVPDLDQPLQAIATENKFYSIFRVESDAARVIELVGKITQRGDETAVIRVEEGYAVCILEPEAQLRPSL